jgi:hypothetical protein
MLVIDDFGRPPPASTLGPAWELVTDGVMGGVSRGMLRFETISGRRCLRLTGEVSLANNGGFVQAALDLAPAGGCLDARRFTALELDVCGPPNAYGVHLRTTDHNRPWQSCRAGFATAADWRTVRLLLDDFAPHRTDRPFDPARLRRLGLVAIGRAFTADLAVAGLRLV